MGLLAPLFEPRLIETDPDPEHSWLTALRQQEQELWKAVRNHGGQRRNHLSETSSYILGDAIEWLADLPANSVHGVLTASLNTKKKTIRNCAWAAAGFGGFHRLSMERNGSHFHDSLC